MTRFHPRLLALALAAAALLHGAGCTLQGTGSIRGKVTYQDKKCFRVLWGRYPSAEAAHRALSSAPKFFSTAKNHPAVTGVR